MGSRDCDLCRKFESGSSKRKRAIKKKQVPPRSKSKISEDELTTSLSLRSPVPPSTLSSQEHESEPDSMSTSMTAGMESLNQNYCGLWPITITDVDRTEIVLKKIRVRQAATL
ncbi:unnamed protein product [Pieris macdunnoughi]|uniref:Uncharacterized protein n=1 Tax=Pieris macdunnoughi TaxID=345717 RepID=A0A821RHU2_9NEOP|nr:unnamed protein product [Pieris macdunnoughi]